MTAGAWERENVTKQYSAAPLTQLTWPEGNRYQWGYDEAGRVVSLRDPEDQITALSDLGPQVSGISRHSFPKQAGLTLFA